MTDNKELDRGGAAPPAQTEDIDTQQQYTNGDGPGQAEHAAKKETEPESTEEATAEEEMLALFPGLVEIVRDGHELKFLVKGDDGIVRAAASYENPESGKVLVPPSLDAIPYQLVSFRDVVSTESFDTDDLYSDIIARLKGAAHLPSEAYYHLCATFIFFTYVSPAAQHLPYLWFHGLPGRGKSRIVKAMCRMCWRGFYTETLNPATLFRFADRFRGTMAMDVVDIIGAVQRVGSHDLLLGRFEQGLKTARVLNYEMGPFNDTAYFDISGPTIIATNTYIPDEDPLSSRCIRISMPEVPSHGRGGDPLPGQADIRARLLAFRAKYMDQPLPQVDKPADGRLGDLMRPLYAVAEWLPAEARDNVKRLLADLEAEQTSSQAESLPGRVMAVIHRRQNDARQGRLRVSTIATDLSEDEDFGVRVTVQQVGNELKALGIDRRKSNGVMHVIWKDRGMEALFRRFGLVEDVSPVSLASPGRR